MRNRNQMLRAVMKLVREAWPTRQQLPLNLFEPSKMPTDQLHLFVEPQKVDDVRWDPIESEWVYLPASGAPEQRHT